MQPETISKANMLKPAEDYDNLRKQGIKNIERLGSNIWTDFNTHDPGITLLEGLCYAITDLAYRTGFEMKDLVAPEPLNTEPWKNIFYTAKQILPCNPVTINDYRKLLVDIPGVRNAWIITSKSCEVPVFINYTDIKKDAKFAAVLEYQKDSKPCCCEDSIKLPGKYNAGTQIAPDIQTCNGLQFKGDTIIELNGLYKIVIEYEEDVKEKNHRQDVLDKVNDTLQSHRSVCEDFLTVTATEEKHFKLQTQVVLNEDADADKVLAEICFRIQNYFTPSIRFYTIEELRSLEYEDEYGNKKKGFDTEEIFEGPILKHGFIPDFVMRNTDVFRDMRLSDLINEVMDIEGVIALKRFIVIDPETPDTEDAPWAKSEFFEEWMERMKADALVGKLDIDDVIEKINATDENESIRFYKSYGQVTINVDRFKKLLNDLKAFERNRKLKGHTNDLSVPSGEYRDLGNYYPIQYDFPEVYGTGEAGYEPNTNARRIEVLQLKAYLSIYEQLLSDYLAQLGNLRNLFSFDENVETTYAVSNLLEGVLGYDPKNDTGIREYMHIYLHAKDYFSDFKKINEPGEIFGSRRNKFLDHLLARFSEDFSEYTSFMQALFPGNYQQRLIEDKINALKAYPSISNDRGRAFNYTWVPEEDDDDDYVGEKKNTPVGSQNVSGLEKRICRLLGIKNYRRRTLSPSNLLFTEDATTGKTTITLYDKDDAQELLLTSVPVDSECIDEIVHCLIEKGCAGHFVLYPENKDEDHKPNKHKYYFELLNDDGTRIAFSKNFRDDRVEDNIEESKRRTGKEKRNEALKKTIATLRGICSNEGMHMIEHILLRPKGDDLAEEIYSKPEPNPIIPLPYELLNICINQCDLEINAVPSPGRVNYKFDIAVLHEKICVGGERWRVRLLSIPDPAILTDTAKIIFSNNFKTYEQAAAFITTIREYGSEKENYTICREPDSDRYYFILYVDKRKVIESAIEFKITIEPTSTAKKKFHLIERKRETERLFGGQENKLDLIDKLIDGIKEMLNNELDLYGCEDFCAHNADPYSFRLTFVLPCWPKRFHDKSFRNFVERTIRNETPAHIHTHIFWLDPLALRKFETPYFAWLKEMAEDEGIPENKIANDFICQFNMLTNCGEPCKEEKK